MLKKAVYNCMTIRLKEPYFGQNDDNQNQLFKAGGVKKTHA